MCETKVKHFGTFPPYYIENIKRKPLPLFWTPPGGRRKGMPHMKNGRIISSRNRSNHDFFSYICTRSHRKKTDKETSRKPGRGTAFPAAKQGLSPHEAAFNFLPGCKSKKTKKNRQGFAIKKNLSIFAIELRL